jgi:outer membrane lipoprotein-sorting protein
MWLGCPSATPPSSAALVAQVKRRQLERDAKLNSYHVVVDSTQGEATARHEFYYRAPNRSQGTLWSPEALTLSFDGTRFFKVTPAEKKFETYALKLSKDDAAYFLASTFTPFVPEGYRTLLLPSRGVTARLVTHPKAREAVEVTVSVDEVTVVWVLRWPSGDVLSKRVGATEVTVDDEWCDTALGLCVPKRVTQRRNGVVEATTSLTAISLNPQIPNDFFTLVPAEGFHTEQRELVESKSDESLQQKADASWQP